MILNWTRPAFLADLDPWHSVRSFCLSWCLLAVFAACSHAQQSNAPGDSFDSILHQAFDFHQQADYAHALPLLQRAWKLEPHDYFANLLMGIDLLRTRQPALAIRFLKEASRLHPQEDFPYEYAGEAEALLGHYADASESYIKAMKARPDSPEAMEGWSDYSLERFRQLASELRSSDQGLAAEYRLQARSYKLDDPKRSDLLRQSAALDADDPGVWSELAFVDLVSGDQAKAQDDVEEALAKDTFDLRALEVQALVAARAGNWKQGSSLLNAIADHSPGFLEHAVADWPPSLHPVKKEGVSETAASFFDCVNHPTSKCDLAPAASSIQASARNTTSSPDRLFREQRWNRVIAAREPTPSDTQAWFHRGVAFAELGRCEAAIPALERGLADRAEPVFARFLLSWCYADAAGSVDAAIRSKGGDQAISHLIRGDVLLRMQGDNNGSILEYKAALAARGNDPKLLERLAEAQLGAGLFDEAAESAHQALRLDTRRYSARQTLARVSMDQGRYDEALPILKELAADDPKDEGTQVSLATTLAQTGDPEAALEHLQPALERGYPDAKGSLHSLLGTLLHRVGRQAEAAQAFATARQLSDSYQRSAHRDPKPQEEPR